MPFSYTTFDQYISSVITSLQPVTVLDVGAGAGKYGKMLGELAVDCKSTAIEIDASYVHDYDLRSLYHDVIVADVMTLLDQPRVRFDLVIIGDCIEHLKKSDGVDLLNFLIYRTGYICIVYPDAFEQDDIDGHMAEAHRSTWNIYDFQGWSTIHKSWDSMHLALIKGYQPSRLVFTG